MTRKIPFGKSLGTLVGSGPEFGLLRAVVAFQERDNIPPLGSFLIVEGENSKQILVARLEKVDYTDYHTSASRREESLVVAYLQRLGQYGTGELTEEEKKALFFNELLLRILGRLVSGKFESGLRLLPPLTAALRYPSKEELNTLLSLGIQDETSKRPLPLAKVGHFALGTNEYTDFPVLFSPARLEQRRTAVFAQTGYGKSNLTKLLVSLAAWMSRSGVLILDLDGEYALGKADTPSTTKGALPKKAGKEMYGLASIPALLPRLSVFSLRAGHIRQQCPNLDVHPMMDLRRLSTFQLRRLMQVLEPERSTIRDFSLDGQARQNFEEWLNTLEQDQEDFEKQNNALQALLDRLAKKEHQGPLRRALRTLGLFHQPTGENPIDAIRRALAKRRVVIVDLSGWPMSMAWSMAEVLTDNILVNNLKAMTTPRKQIPVIAVVEEAQNVLNKQALDRGGVFIRWAKEGRKLGLGLVYITQQPGAIAEEIVSQSDNFFVMHLMSRVDTRALTRGNPKYEGVIEEFILHEPIKGNAYVYSAPDQPFVFPTRILHFTPDQVARVLNLEGFDWKNMAQRLDDFSNRPKEDYNRIIGRVSHLAYEFLYQQSQQAKDHILWPEWVELQNKRLRFEQAERLLAYLVFGLGAVRLSEEVQDKLQQESGWFTVPRDKYMINLMTKQQIGDEEDELPF